MMPQARCKALIGFTGERFSLVLFGGHRRYKMMRAPLYGTPRLNAGFRHEMLKAKEMDK